MKKSEHLLRNNSLRPEEHEYLEDFALNPEGLARLNVANIEKLENPMNKQAEFSPNMLHGNNNPTTTEGNQGKGLSKDDESLENLHPMQIQIDYSNCIPTKSHKSKQKLLLPSKKIFKAKRMHDVNICEQYADDSKDSSPLNLKQESAGLKLNHAENHKAPMTTDIDSQIKKIEFESPLATAKSELGGENQVKREATNFKKLNKEFFKTHPRIKRTNLKSAKVSIFRKKLSDLDSEQNDTKLTGQARETIRKSFDEEVRPDLDPHSSVPNISQLLSELVTMTTNCKELVSSPSLKIQYSKNFLDEPADSSQNDRNKNNEMEVCNDEINNEISSQRVVDVETQQPSNSHLLNASITMEPTTSTGLEVNNTNQGHNIPIEHNPNQNPGNDLGELDSLTPSQKTKLSALEARLSNVENAFWDMIQSVRQILD